MKNTCGILIFCGIVFFQGICSALQNKQKLIVFELANDLMDSTELQVLTNELTAELMSTGVFTLIDQPSIQKKISIKEMPNPKECETYQCYAQIALSAGAQVMVLGDVAVIDSVYTIHTRIISLPSLKIEKTASALCDRCSMVTMRSTSLRTIAGILASPFSAAVSRDEKNKKEQQTIAQQQVAGQWVGETSNRMSTIGIFLFSLGTTLLGSHEIISEFTPKLSHTKDQLILACTDLALVGIAVPILLVNGESSNYLTDSIDGSRMKLGLRIGCTRQHLIPISFQFDDQFQPALGLSVGWSIDYSLNSYCGVLNEGLFVQKRVFSRFPSNKVDLELDYAEIPILVRASLPLKIGFYPSSYCGVSPALLIKNVATNMKSTGEKIIQTSSKISIVDLSFTFGVKGTINLPKGQLFIDLRSNEGLLFLGEEFKEKSSSTHSRTFSVSCGYYF